MIRRIVTVTLENGLHMVPASEIAKAVRDFHGRVVLRRDNIIADAHSVLDLLQLRAECGTNLEVEAEGDGDALVVDAIAQLFALNFAVERPTAARRAGTDGT
ncbi:MAG: HPr family phosphocarrier protein [Planctomycetaceae bacterium]|nr:HPr family phosphocarrier protein [Planctomycetaceae bacterium]